MQSTPCARSAVPGPRGHWLQRSLTAILLEHRLPYTASIVLDRWCNAVGLRQKTIVRMGLKVRVRRQTCDEAFVQNVIVNSEYTIPGFQIHEHDTVIDVGANIGTFSLVAARAARRGRVFAFEPNPDNYGLLLGNIRRNRMRNIVPTPAAVGGVSGQAKLYCSSQGGFHSLLEDRIEDAQRYEVVASVSLKEIFDAHEIERCDFLKLDCEGAEYEILYGLPDAYFSRIRRIAMEYHGAVDRTTRQAQADALVAHLAGRGFDIVEYTEFVGFRGGFIRAERAR